MKEKMSYEKAAKTCHLTETEIMMAMSLGILPQSLVRAQSSYKHEKWKDAPALWIRRLYEKETTKREIILPRAWTKSTERLSRKDREEIKAALLKDL